MKKTILTTAIALTMSAGLAAPAQAAERETSSSQTHSVDRSVAPGSFTTLPVRLLVGLLLPAVQAARED